MSPEPNSTTAPEQRRKTRNPLNATVTMRFDPSGVEGTADNMSSVGLMFFTDDALRVTVEFEEDGKVHTRQGRLVRVQRMNDTNTGVALEFDEAA